MHKCNFSFFTLLFINCCFGQIRWIHPQPNGNTLYSVCFKNSKEIFAAGNAGTLLKSEDSGKTWQLKPTGVYEDFLCVKFPGPNRGYVCGSNGYFARSTDGGKTWLKRPTPVNQTIQCMFWIDSLKGYVGGDMGILYFTRDGGDSWEAQYSGYSTNPIMAIYFRDSFHGYLAGGYGFYAYTNNKGKTWTKSNLPSQSWGTGVYFSDSLNGIISARFGTGTLFITKNAGKTWTNISQKENNVLNGLCFINSAKILCPAQQGAVYNFDLNGKYAYENLTYSHIYYDIQFRDSNYGIVAGDNGVIARSLNGGKTWNFTTKWVINKLNMDLFYLDSNHIYVANSHLHLLQTNIQGTRLDTVKYSPTGVNSVFAIDSNHVFIGLNDKIIHKHDGKSDTSQLAIDDFILDINFINPNFGIAISNQGNIYKTDNGGLVWQKTNYSKGNYLRKIAFNGIGSIWIAGDDSILLHSTDTGTTWKITKPGFSRTYGTLTFTGKDSALLCTGNGRIYKTVDDGKNWVLQKKLSLPVSINGISQNKNHTWICTGYGDVFHSNNNAESWIDSFHILHDVLTEIHAIDTNYFIATGNEGNVVTNYPKYAPKIVPPDTAHPFEKYLFPVPNPFHGEIRIKHKNLYLINAKLYDATGRLVLESQKYNLNTSNLSDGIYFLRILNSDNEVRVYKLIKTGQ